MFSDFVLFIVLVGLSGFFSACETAFFSLSRVHLFAFEESSSTLAKRVVEFLREPRQILVTILLGNELVNVSISIVGAEIISRLIPASVEVRTLIAVVVITPILLLFGEIAPKTIALKLARYLAPVFIVPLELFHHAVSPLRYVLTGIADCVVRLFGGRPEASQPMVMEQEFRRLVDLGRTEGIIVEEERELIHNVFEFTNKVVREIMTPIERIFSLPIDIDYEAMLSEIRATEYSRIPLYEASKEKIVGILHVRDLFAYDRKRRQGSEEDLRSLLLKPVFVQGDEGLEPLLRRFQEYHHHMALVVDGNEKLIGLVTLHDVLEELFGAMEA